LILLDRNLSDFQQKVKQEHWHWCDFFVHDLEEVSQLFSRHVNEVGLSDFIRLVPDPVLPLNVIVLAHKLQELESSSVSDDTLLVVDLFIDCDGFKHILPENVFLVDVVKVVVVDCCRGEGVVGVLFGITIVYILEDELSKF
jgi:hypothetical protein